MKYLIPILFLLSLSSSAQKTTVTAQVKDSSGDIYANCGYNAVFVGQASTGGPYLVSGSTFQTSLPGSRCDSNGNISVQVFSNTAISPTPSQWQFNVCDQTGIYCFSVLETVTGTTQDISADLTAAAPIIPPFLTLGIFGSGTKVATTSLGSNPANLDCVVWLTGGKLGDAGAPCGTGGGGGGGGGTVTGVTASSPLASSGGNSPNITIQAASGSQNGYLSSTDWTTFNGKQAALGFTPENVANKNAASGYAGLDAGTKLSATQLGGSSGQDSSHFLRGDRTWATLPASGLQDPGSNGPLKRTALNTTAVATNADIIALWTGGCDATKSLVGDGSCQTRLSGSGTNGLIPLWNSATSTTNSDLSNTVGVAVNSAVPITVSGRCCVTEATLGTSPGLPGASFNKIAFGSANDVVHSANNAAYVHMNDSNDFSGVKTCGTTTTCSGTALTAPKIVIGQATLAAGTATVSSIPAFTSSSSFYCVGTDTTAANAVKIVNASSSSITITGTGTDVINYNCTGN